MPTFDIDAARQSGASDDEILSYLSQRSPNFDVQGALQAASKQDVIGYLATHSSAPAGISNAQAAPAAPPDSAHQNRMFALSGLTGMPTPDMSEEDRASFQRGKAAGAISVPVVAGATLTAGSGALWPIAQKWGIKALTSAATGAGARAGWDAAHDLYKELKTALFGDTQ